MEENYEYEKGSKDPRYFRDSISTVDEQGKRKWVYPKEPSGKFYNYRKIVSYILLVFLFTGPFLRINGQPVLLLNVLERKFVILGTTFWPQDFHLFGLAMITLVVFIVLFTVVFGRIFCGWICPQTIFMEMVFRRIEYWIEGSDSQQKKLSAAPWDMNKIIKRGGKLVIFFIISFIIGNTFLAYIIGSDEWIKLVTEPVSQNIGGFSAMMAFSAVFFFVFAYMREQVCVAVCPYGRLQGVMLDPNSIVVHYDFVRGEPRGKIRKAKNNKKKPTTAAPNPLLAIQDAVSEAAAIPEVANVEVPPLGDCIDCGLCVKVCPTGIDIRNGTQLECVNCTACIDACDEVMVKVKRPTGLIRYASYNNIEKQEKFSFTPRVTAYSVVLVGLIGLLGFLLSGRNPVEATVLRTPGKLFYEVGTDTISNLYNYNITNKTVKAMDLTLKVKDEVGVLQMIGNPIITIEEQGIAKGSFFIKIPKDELKDRKTPLMIEVYQGDKLIETDGTNFLYK